MGCVPDTGSSGSTDIDLLLHSDEALRSYILPRILNLREEYYILRQRSAIVPGQAWYRLPTRAAFNKLRAVWNVSGSDRLRIESAFDDNSGSGYMLEGNGVRLLPDDNHALTGEIEFVFYQRPGSLVLTEDARQVLTVDPVTGILTFATDVPVAWTSVNTFDVHSQHSGAELKLWDQAVTVPALPGPTMTFSSAIDGSVFGTKPIEVGDWVVMSGHSSLPALPVELHGALARQVAMHMAESAGDVQAVQIHGQVIEKYFSVIEKAMEQRIESKPMRLGGGGKGFLCRL